MTRLPRLTEKEIIAVLCNAGFNGIRIKGSHHFLLCEIDLGRIFRRV